MRGVGELLVFEARKIERLAPDDRATAVEAGLFLVERQHLASEETRRVAESVLAEKAEPGSSEGVGARLGHRVDDGAVHAAVLGVVPVRFDLELLDVLLAVALVRPAAALVGDVHAVDLVLRHVAAGCANLNRAGVAARTR